MIRPDFKGAGFAWLRMGHHLSVLSAIQDLGMEMALWRRTLPPCLAWWLERFPADQLPDGRVLCPLTDLRAAVASLMTPVGPIGPMQDLLLDDIVELGRIFVRESGCDLLDVRLERLDDDGCAAFHRDHVELRLLTTYRGPGAEWVHPQDAEYALAMQRDYGGPVHRFPTHAVALVRGSKAAGASGLVHRSPPIEGTGQTRLLLCLNTPSAASPERWIHPATSRSR